MECASTFVCLSKRYVDDNMALDIVAWTLRLSFFIVDGMCINFHMRFPILHANA